MNTDNFLDELCELDPDYYKDVSALEEKYNCEISCSTELHNPLQLTYFYEVDFGKKELFFVEIESGINNGTQMNSAEWGSDTKQTTKMVDVLKDIKLNYNLYDEGSFMKRKAQAVLDNNKSKLFEFHRKNNYDNYVTGGNSKMKLDPLLTQLHLDYIYEQQEVDCNFI
jgi:hypothetical protein